MKVFRTLLVAVPIVVSLCFALPAFEGALSTLRACRKSGAQEVASPPATTPVGAGGGDQSERIRNRHVQYRSAARLRSWPQQFLIAAGIVLYGGTIAIALSLAAKLILGQPRGNYGCTLAVLVAGGLPVPYLVYSWLTSRLGGIFAIRFDRVRALILLLGYLILYGAITGCASLWERARLRGRQDKLSGG